MASDAIILPDECMRIVIFSNGAGRVPDGLVRRGDLCVHLNTARHAAEVMGIEETWHELIVRHSGPKHPVPHSLRSGWFVPDSFEGYCHVHFTPTIQGWSSADFWTEYAMYNPGLCPTTGFLAYKCAKALAKRRGLPVVLVGFNPGGDIGSPKAGCHAWQYEAKVLDRERARIVPLVT